MDTVTGDVIIVIVTFGLLYVVGTLFGAILAEWFS